MTYHASYIDFKQFDIDADIQTDSGKKKKNLFIFAGHGESVFYRLEGKSMFIIICLQSLITTLGYMSPRQVRSTSCSIVNHMRLDPRTPMARRDLPMFTSMAMV